MKKHLLLALPLAALVLAACGQKTTTPPGGQNPPTEKLYTKVGLVQAIKFDSNSGVMAEFGTLSPTALPKSPDPSTLDTCQLGDGVNALIQLTTPVINSSYGPLDAGDAITFKKNGMAFATISRMDMQPQALPNYVYQARNLVLSGLSDLTLSVPGATGGFPAFTDVSFPVPNPAFSLTKPTDLKTITSTTNFTWTGASNDPAAVVLFFVKQGNMPFFFCTARDDGSFTIPSDFQDVLKAQKFTQGIAGAVQSLTQVKTSGDALLIMQSLSGVGDF
ncbi:hypothetical protein GCM10022631_27990 [Deinococcus rubellus]|uniref:Lipoprotein n=1 Tax=Deinococcus rubellus TaxID=1889240 RepID=A0ABY5YJX2_9DEIO|nr:hypothetical protein [Deinococcus rubellus]UWX65433.1 hypothetical protein N0D28_07205 [Deinococcus rubellus]